MTMAGGYQTTGERANVPDYGGWITGRGNDEMTMLKGYARMREFFESFEWWKLEPRPDLVNSNAMCLAEMGRRYVVYLPDGGRSKLALDDNINAFKWGYDVRRFNPRTAEYRGLPKALLGPHGEAAAWTSPPMPKNENWVFLLERGSMFSESSGSLK